MLSWGSIRSRPAWRGNIFVCIVAAGISTGLNAKAQTPQDNARQQITAPLADWADAMRVHRLVEQWVAQGDTKPARAAEANQEIKVAGVAGVCITLRWSGMTRGRGHWTAPRDPMPPRFFSESRVVDLVEAARVATAMALGQVKKDVARNRARLTDGDGASRKGMSLEDVLPRLLVGVQIARTPEPVQLAANAPPNAVLHSFVPGYHGLVLTPPYVAEADGGGRAVRRRMGWTWPAEALAANLPPQKQLINMLVSIRLPRDQLDSVAKPGGPELHRFETIHVIRPAHNQPPLRLIRGNVLLPAKGLSHRDFEAVGRRLADHLADRQRKTGTMIGTYRPTTSRYDPADASLVDHALAMYAMARWLNVNRHTLSEESTEHIRKALDRAAGHLTRRLMVVTGLEDPAAAAFAMMAMIEAPHLSSRKIERDALARSIARCQADDGSFRSAPGAAAKPLSPLDHTLLLAAMLKFYDQKRDPALLPKFRGAYAWLTGSNSTPGVVMLPFLAQVTADMQRLPIEPGQADAVAVAPSAELFTAAAAGLMQRQIQLTPDLRPSDVVGGFDLRVNWPRSKTHQPDADWRTAHALMFLAIMLRQPEWRVGQAESISDVELVLSCSLAGRFLAQLMYDQPGCYYSLSHADMVGGVRQALWRNGVGIRPTAIALLAVSELEHSLELWQQRTAHDTSDPASRKQSAAAEPVPSTPQPTQ